MTTGSTDTPDGAVDERGHPRDDRRRRELALALPGVVAAVAVVVSSLLLADRVPATVPSRWGADGLVVDTLPLWGLTLAMGALVVVLAGVLAVVGRRIGPHGAQRLASGLAVGAPLAVLALHVGTLLAAAEGGADARFPGGAGLVALGLLVVGTAVTAAVVEPVDQPTTHLAVRTVEVVPGEAVVWSGRTSAPRWLSAVLVATGVVTVPLAAVEVPWVGGLVLVVVLLALSLLTARVTVGPAGLRIRLGPLGVVRLDVPLDEIVAVDAIEVDPLAHGGWGVRLMPGLRAVVFRSGPGLRVEQRDGPTTVVTLDRAAEAAGVLRAHVDARAAAVRGG